MGFNYTDLFAPVLGVAGNLIVPGLGGVAGGLAGAEAAQYIGSQKARRRAKRNFLAEAGTGVAFGLATDVLERGKTSLPVTAFDYADAQFHKALGGVHGLLFPDKPKPTDKGVATIQDTGDAHVQPAPAPAPSTTPPSSGGSTFLSDIVKGGLGAAIGQLTGQKGTVPVPGLGDIQLSGGGGATGTTSTPTEPLLRSSVGRDVAIIAGVAVVGGLVLFFFTRKKRR